MAYRDVPLPSSGRSSRASRRSSRYLSSSSDDSIDGLSTADEASAIALASPALERSNSSSKVPNTASRVLSPLEKERKVSISSHSEESSDASSESELEEEGDKSRGLYDSSARDVDIEKGEEKKGTLWNMKSLRSGSTSTSRGSRSSKGSGGAAGEGNAAALASARRNKAAAGSGGRSSGKSGRYYEIGKEDPTNNPTTGGFRGSPNPAATGTGAKPRSKKLIYIGIACAVLACCAFIFAGWRIVKASHQKSEAEAATSNATSTQEGSTYIPTGSGSDGLNPIPSGSNTMEIVKPENLAVEGAGPTDSPQAEFAMPTGRVGIPLSVAHASGPPAFPGSNSSLLMGNSSMNSTMGRNATSSSMSGGMNVTHSVAGNGSFSMNGTHGGEGGVRFTTTLPTNNATSSTSSSSAFAESTTLSSTTASASSTTLTSSPAPTTAISTTMTSSESAKSTTISSLISSSLSAGSSPSSTSTAGTPKYPGRATWFRSSQHLTSCRTVTEDTDLVAALQHELYGANGTVSPFCGSKINVYNPASQTNITVTVADDCMECIGEMALDLSVTAFQALGDLGAGVLEIQWSFENPADVLKMPANTSFVATTASTINRTTDSNGYETRVIEEGGLERRGERVKRGKVTGDPLVCVF